MLILKPEDLEASQRRRLEGHLGECPACQARSHEIQEVGSLLGRELARREAPFAQEATPVLRRVRTWPWWLGAAAVLLLCIKLLRPEAVPVRPPQGSGQAVEVEAVPPPLLQGFCRAETEDLEGVLGRSVLAALRKGGVLDARGARPVLIRGALHLDAPGEAMTLKAGEALLTFEDASLTLEIMGRPAPLAWLASVFAEDGAGVRVAVWRGSVEATIGGSPKTTLKEGQGALIQGGRLIPEQTSGWRGTEGWMPLEPAPFSLRDAARELLHEPPQGYVLEALVRKRLPVAELGVRMPGASGVYELPVGGSLQAAAWTRLRLERRRGWHRISLGSSEVLSGPESRLRRAGALVEGKGVGLRAWGGDVEVKQVRWRIAE